MTEGGDPGATPGPKEATERARALVKRQLGEALADKATDEFCLSYAHPGPPFGALRLLSARAESLTLAPPGAEQQVAVIELGRREEEPVPAEDVAVALGGPGVSEAVEAARQALGEEIGPAERALSLLAREAAIRTERDRFYREVGGLRDHVERAAAALAAATGERPRIGIAAAPVQACWLNGTIRTASHASLLGDVAADSAVERIDVPRPIRPEIVDVTIEGAAQQRAKTGESGAGVLVGVIDSEVQLDHPSLQGRVVHRRNYTQEPFGTPDFHGTAVAGLIAASGGGFEGMAPAAHIYNYKVLATQSALAGTDFEGALAIQHALEDGVQVVNCSWGSGPAGDGSGREARACDKAWALGMVIVKSAGNEGPGAQTLTTPADAEGVLVVGATTADGSRVGDYSSHGPTGDGRRRPHVVAPGGDAELSIDGILTGGGTGPLSEYGTSFAAPHVTGLVALLVEKEPNLAPDQLRDRIVKSCRRLAGAEPDAEGAGLVTLDALA